MYMFNFHSLNINANHRHVSQATNKQHMDTFTINLTLVIICCTNVLPNRLKIGECNYLLNTFPTALRCF